MTENADPQAKKLILKRLHRIGGQLKGIERMIEDERPCEEIMLQLAAVKAAIVQSAMKIMEVKMGQCLYQGGEKRQIEEKWYKLMDILRKFA